jgi:hypothetical protein
MKFYILILISIKLEKVKKNLLINKKYYKHY